MPTSGSRGTDVGRPCGRGVATEPCHRCWSVGGVAPDFAGGRLVTGASSHGSGSRLTPADARAGRVDAAPSGRVDARAARRTRQPGGRSSRPGGWTLGPADVHASQVDARAGRMDAPAGWTSRRPTILPDSTHDTTGPTLSPICRRWTRPRVALELDLSTDRGARDRAGRPDRPATRPGGVLACIWPSSRGIQRVDGSGGVDGAGGSRDRAGRGIGRVDGSGGSRDRASRVIRRIE